MKLSGVTPDRPGSFPLRDGDRAVAFDDRLTGKSYAFSYFFGTQRFSLTPPRFGGRINDDPALIADPLPAAREIHEDISYDLNYIRQMGLFCDLRILAQTLFCLAALPFHQPCKGKKGPS